MSFEDTLRAIVREEVQSALSSLGTATAAEQLYRLSDLPKATSVSVSSLKRLRADGYLVGEGEGKLVRYTVAAVREALRKKAATSGGVRSLAVAALRRRAR